SSDALCLNSLDQFNEKRVGALTFIVNPGIDTPVDLVDGNSPRVKLRRKRNRIIVKHGRASVRLGYPLCICYWHRVGLPTSRVTRRRQCSAEPITPQAAFRGWGVGLLIYSFLPVSVIKDR